MAHLKAVYTPFRVRSICEASISPVYRPGLLCFVNTGVYSYIRCMHVSNILVSSKFHPQANSCVHSVSVDFEATPTN